MKKNTLSCIALILVFIVFAVVIAACSGGDETPDSPDSSQSSDISTSDAGDDKVYKLSLSTHDPATSTKTKFHEEWAERVREASGGRLDIAIYSASSLVAGNAALDGLRTGVCDIAWIFTPYFADQFPLCEVVCQPIGLTAVPQATNLLWDMYESDPAFQAELAEFVPLMIHTNPGSVIGTTSDKPVVEFADAKGLKLRVSGGAGADYLSIWGASPAQMAPGDIFQAIERKTVDGAVFDYSGVISFSLESVLGNYADFPVFRAPYLLLMNRDSFESLP
jgi:TRAP-type C4-dicarboxylate transport system substrate-binding protein